MILPLFFDFAPTFRAFPRGFRGPRECRDAGIRVGGSSFRSLNVLDGGLFFVRLIISDIFLDLGSLSCALPRGLRWYVELIRAEFSSESTARRRDDKIQVADQARIASMSRLTLPPLSLWICLAKGEEQRAGLLKSRGWRNEPSLFGSQSRVS